MKVFLISIDTHIWRLPSAVGTTCYENVNNTFLGSHNDKNYENVNLVNLPSWWDAQLPPILHIFFSKIPGTLGVVGNFKKSETGVKLMTTKIATLNEIFVT